MSEIIRTLSFIGIGIATGLFATEEQERIVAFSAIFLIILPIIESAFVSVLRDIKYVHDRIYGENK